MDLRIVDLDLHLDLAVAGLVPSVITIFKRLYLYVYVALPQNFDIARGMIPTHPSPEAHLPKEFLGAENLKFAKNSVHILLYLRGLWEEQHRILHMVYGINVSQNQLF